MFRQFNSQLRWVFLLTLNNVLVIITMNLVPFHAYIIYVKKMYRVIFGIY